MMVKNDEEYAVQCVVDFVEDDAQIFFSLTLIIVQSQFSILLIEYINNA